MLEQLIGGLALGGVYALIALGYTMVYGIIGLINFAHGEVMMLGTFYVYAFSTGVDPAVASALGVFAGCTVVAASEAPLRVRMAHRPRAASLGIAVLCGVAGGWAARAAAIASLHPAPAIALALVYAAVLGVALERLAYRPLRNAPRLAPLISAIGASLFFQNLAQLIFGTHRQPLAMADALSGRTLPGTDVPLTYALIIASAVTVMVLLHLFITRTRLGTALRATEQDRKAAALMGININMTIGLTFAIGSSLAAIGGLLFSIHQKTVWSYMGFMAGIKAFTAAVLGGIGSVPGAMFGGFLLGLIESLGAAALPEAGYKDAIAFTILILVLLFRPTGLMGRKAQVKV